MRYLPPTKPLLASICKTPKVDQMHEIEVLPRARGKLKSHRYDMMSRLLRTREFGRREASKISDNSQL